MNTIILPKTQHLVVFQEVIKSGSIGSAARQLGLTQPAVSKIISDIESYFGVEVMVRKNTGVKLTAAGGAALLLRVDHPRNEKHGERDQQPEFQHRDGRFLWLPITDWFHLPVRNDQKIQGSVPESACIYV